MAHWHDEFDDMGRDAFAPTLGRDMARRLAGAREKSPLRGVPSAALGALALVSLVAVVACVMYWWPKGAESGFAITSSTSSGTAFSASIASAAGDEGEQGAAASDEAGSGSSAAEAFGEAQADYGESAASGIFVDVAGAVQSPGVYELWDGARVIDAVNAAGGARDDAQTSQVNLARLLSDGEQVYIPTAEEALGSQGASGASATGGGASGAAASQGSADASSSKININTATAEQLEELSGIGPAIAQKIIDDRNANGPFASIEDIQRVSGIGEKKYAAIADQITV